MGRDITGIGSIANLATGVINKIWPDKTEAEKAQLAAAVALVQGQLDINKTEAASGNVFVAGWRPAIGWVCALAMLWQYIVRPMIVLFKPTLVLPGMDDTLWQLMFAMLGLGGLRTFEKAKGVA